MYFKYQKYQKHIRLEDECQFTQNASSEPKCQDNQTLMHQFMCIHAQKNVQTISPSVLIYLFHKHIASIINPIQPNDIETSQKFLINH